MGEDIIGDLIRMDEQARATVEGAAQRCDAAKAEIEEDALAMREKYLERARHRVEKVRAQVQKDCESQAAHLQTSFDAAQAALDESYAKNRARWVDEIVNRCKQKGLTQ